MNIIIHLQEHSSDCLLCHIKVKAKQAVEYSQSCVKPQWFKDLRYKDLSNNCLVIVIVYAKGINRGITEKSNCCCLHQVVNSGTHNKVNNKE